MQITLEEMGLRIHSDIRFASGRSDCPGALQVMGWCGSWVEVECKECFTTVMVKPPPDMSWQKRKDLA